jgi:hypothetical protein
MLSRLGAFFSHPTWAGISAVATVFALFCAGFGQQTLDRITHLFSTESATQSKSSTKGEKSAANHGQRIALVIGNKGYSRVAALENPLNDINLIAETLESRGFKVIKKADLDYLQMKKSIADFQTILSSGGIGLIYYSGHAAYADGEDILFPVDVDASSYEIVNEVAKTRGVSLTRRPTDVIYLTDLLKPVDKIFEKQPLFNGVATIYSTSKYKLAYDVFLQSKDRGHSPFASAFAESVQDDEELFYLFRSLTKKVSNMTKGEQIPSIEASMDVEFFFSRPWRDESIGILKLVVIDGCRTDPSWSRYPQAIDGPLVIGK